MQATFEPPAHPAGAASRATRTRAVPPCPPWGCFCLILYQENQVRKGKVVCLRTRFPFSGGKKRASRSQNLNEVFEIWTCHIILRAAWRAGAINLPEWRGQPEAGCPAGKTALTARFMIPRSSVSVLEE